MLELATLGLLQRQPLHGYKLKQQLELFMSSCISVNFGSIYPLLNRLEEAGLISTVVTEEENCCEQTSKPARTSKIYKITEAGCDRWLEKMLEHPQESWVNSRSRFIIKFFFFSHLEPSARIKLLEHRLMVCRLREEQLESQPKLTDAYQISVWNYGMQVLLGEIEWLTEQLAKESAKCQV